MVTFAKNTTVLCALVTLACECAVTGTAWDLIPCLPLLVGALAVLYATHTLSPACKSYLNKQLSAKPWKGKGGGTAGSSLASIAPEARASMCMSSAHHAKDPVGALGGCGPAALLLSEANILSDSDASSSHEATQRLVDSAIKGIVSSAVVAALIFSTMYEFAYEEGEALQRLVAAGPASGWGIEEAADLTSCNSLHTNTPSLTGKDTREVLTWLRAERVSTRRRVRQADLRSRLSTYLGAPASVHRPLSPILPGARVDF